LKSAVAIAAMVFVSVPEVPWEALRPYVRANIVAQMHGDDFHVFVCQDQADRTVVTRASSRASRRRRRPSAGACRA
jgi:hypothetical protein